MNNSTDTYEYVTGHTLPICHFCPEHCSVSNVWEYADEARITLRSVDGSAVLSIIVRAFDSFHFYTKT